jgi:hypothetical protein
MREEEQKAADGIGLRGIQVLQDTLRTAPWRYGDEIVVCVGKIGSCRDVGGDGEVAGG